MGVRAKRPKLIFLTGHELAEKIIHLHREGKLQVVKAFLKKACRKNRYDIMKNVIKALDPKFSKLSIRDAANKAYGALGKLLDSNEDELSDTYALWNTFGLENCDATARYENSRSILTDVDQKSEDGSDVES